MIQINHFYKAYNSQKDFTVEDVSINVENGKIVGLLGPNGSGKTTIMKAICGIHYATKGQISVSGLEVQNNTGNIMKKVGYVPEISVLPSELTVYSFLNYVASVHDIQNKENAIKKVCEQCSIEKFLNTKIAKLSKGQKQRVSFAQALIYDPENLIFDEPVSGLDPAQIQQMRELIKQLSKTKAILLSTHILQEINSLCNELYILNQGKIIANGTPEQIIESTGCDSLEAAFIKLTKESQYD